MNSAYIIFKKAQTCIVPKFRKKIMYAFSFEFVPMQTNYQQSSFLAINPPGNARSLYLTLEFKKIY